MNGPQDELALRVSRMLEERYGSDQGITIRDLQVRLGLPNRRECEDLLEQAFESLGFIAVAGNRGYHRPKVSAELNDYERNLRSRIKKLARRLAIVRRLAPREGWRKEGGQWVAPPKQMEMSYERQESEADFQTAGV